MRTRIVAVAVGAGLLAFGVGPGADATTANPPGERRLMCSWVKTVDLGLCLDNPLPWSVDLTEG